MNEDTASTSASSLAESTHDSEEERLERMKKRRTLDETKRFIATSLLLRQDKNSGIRTQPRTHSSSTSRTSGARRALMFMRDNEGNVVRVLPWMSPWYITYVKYPSLDDVRWSSKFRRLFRVSYPAFCEILRRCRKDENQVYFGAWTHVDQYARVKTPIELLVLGSLRYVGRGWTFDDLEEATCVSEEMHRTFFHKFIDFGSKVLYKLFVTIPETADAIRSQEYEMAGMAGCVGSMDATHVLCERVPHDQSQEHKACKLPGTARTYNLVVNNLHKIYCSTKGHPARWNDKTLVRYDELITMLRYGKSRMLDEFEFTLFEYGSTGEIVSVKYVGAWVLVDNGYLAWSCTIPPFKTTVLQKEIRFLQWLESLRKDVECTFGILKSRFRILKAGVRLHGIEACDKVWLTCCALHNMMLEYDGLDVSDERLFYNWGRFDMDDIDEAIPFSLQRLYTTVQMRNLDTSGMGRGNDRDTDDDAMDEDDIQDSHSEEEQIRDSLDGEGQSRVRYLSMNVFRSKLVDHFDVLYKKKQLRWPRISNDNDYDFA